ncbi:aminopeptidase P family protein [Agrobacterium larrymoorei]|uniref:M24 family metallopeptidase n=1 Tax=Agrobacterium larrymoorei TaxID=160699 RepID=UPI001574C2B7|nr:Xaa-Pro peptidase family protein [Agrobacterium larrymoorei]NTJ44534.1 aminopeptidase P family protein [Agrobacterium larrymoorei]
MLTANKPSPIFDAERIQRIALLRHKMTEHNVGAVLLGSTESLRYFTGLIWHQSERLLGAVITATDLHYIVPGFEKSRVDTLPHIGGEVHLWQEEESPATLVASLVGEHGRVALDDALPLFTYHALAQKLGQYRLIDGSRLIRDLRCRKSASEIAIIKYAMGLTLEVQKRAHSIMKPGTRASDVVRFIDEQHRELGESGSTFCIVSFGAATSLPHGAEGDQILKDRDVILVDTGTRIDGYHSDLTRTYVLDELGADFAKAWTIEREAQQAVFDAAKLGAACSTLDDAAREVLARHGLGPGYALPGLPHRAGHGLGLEIHEEPYIVRGNGQTLAEGMCFSNEPMLVYPDRFGIRLEDHIYMSAEGARWFTQPANSPTEPFA